MEKDKAQEMRITAVENKLKTSGSATKDAS